MSEFAIDGSWPAGLLPPYLERRIEDLMSSSKMGIEWEVNGFSDNNSRPPRDSHHRPDGKPDPRPADREVSRAYFHGAPPHLHVRWSGGG